MNALMKPQGMPLAMSSREIADLTGSTHDNVLKTIRRLIAEGVVSGNETPYTHPQNGQSYMEFLLSFRDTMVVVSGYSSELRAKIIDRWQELEAGVATAIPQSLPEALRLAADLAEQKALAEAERDHAIATKALIGNKREATAMARASSAVREVNRLKEELGRNLKHATIIAVEKAIGRKLGPQDWRPLRNWCKDHGVNPTPVTDPRYGEVKAWPAEAWKDVYGIDLGSIFPEAQAVQ